MTIADRMRALIGDLEESKKNPVVSLSRWMIGARPAIGSYVKKIAGMRTSPQAQASVAAVMSALTQMQQAIATLDQHVPVLLKELGK